MSTSASLMSRPKPAQAYTVKQDSILIIDDDEALVELLARRLQRHGYRTITAGCGTEGLAKARSLRPSVIVLDLRLPDADGLELCSQLVDSPETCVIPVIILSGLEDPEIVRRCRAAGSQYFLRKPYDPNALLVLIRQAIRDCQNWQADDGNCL